MITLNGRLCHRASLHIPWRGRWVAQAALDGAAPSGRVTLTWGGATLVGSVDPTGTGEWQGEARVTVVGGLAWQTVLPALWLQNDAGLTGLAVAQQAAALVKETLVAPASAFRAQRVSFARMRLPASVVLSSLLVQAASWWVEYDGTTRAGVRPSPAVPARVELLELEADHGIAELDANDVGQTLVGSLLAAAPPRRPRAFRIVELNAQIGPQGQRLSAAVEAA